MTAAPEQEPAPEDEVAALEAPTVLEQALGVVLEDRGLLELALTHRSHAFEAGGLPTNERLEFLGDAVLGVVITDWIYHRFPDAPEGRLAKLRAASVNTQRLADVARQLGVGEQVLLGKGEEASGGRDKDSILADTLEALIGAVHLDQGLDGARELVVRLFADLVDELATRRASLDYKTSLQELTASVLSAVPSYEVTEEGPDHRKSFTAEVFVDGLPLGTGTGRSKKEAEQGAAQEAYAVLERRLAVGSDATPPDDEDPTGARRDG